MARGINKVILIGNTGADPEVRYMQNGNAVATLSVATSETWKDKQTGEKQERTEWHRVVCFNRLGEIVAEYVRKGSKLYVEGSLRTRKWQDQQGQDRYTTEILANDIQMLDGKGNGSGMSFDNTGYDNAGANRAQQPANRSGHKGSQAESPSYPEAMSVLDDDIPF